MEIYSTNDILEKIHEAEFSSPIYYKNMAITINQNNLIQCTYPQLFAQGEFYLDWSSFVELSGLPSTNLYRVIKSLNNVPTFKYKNRTYYKTTFCFSLWNRVSEQNK
jgi:hypothetical protein